MSNPYEGLSQQDLNMLASSLASEMSDRLEDFHEGIYQSVYPLRSDSFKSMVTKMTLIQSAADRMVMEA